MAIGSLVSLIKSKKLLIVLSGLVFLLALIFTWRQITTIQAAEEKAFLLRAERIDTYMQSYRTVVKAMADTVKANYLREKTQPTTHPALQKLKNYPEFNVYGISGMAQDQGYEALQGSLTGLGDAATLNDAMRREISAALGLDQQFAMQIDDNSELVWAYYISAKNFIYIAPKQTVAKFHFENTVYEQGLWTRALPSVNPSLQAIVTPLYEDTAGQGLMATISAPVVIDGVLFGVTSVDIGMRTLRALIESGNVIGESTLLTADNFVVARPGNMQADERFTVNLPMNTTGFQSINNDWWLTQPVADGQLILVHRMSMYDVITEALLEVSYIWLVFAALLGLAIIL
jgi:hypothetical protein